MNRVTPVGQSLDFGCIVFLVLVGSHTKRCPASRLLVDTCVEVLKRLLIGAVAFDKLRFQRSEVILTNSRVPQLLRVVQIGGTVECCCILGFTLIIYRSGWLISFECSQALEVRQAEDDS